MQFGNSIPKLHKNRQNGYPVQIKSAETLNDSSYKNLIYFEKISAKKGTVIYGGSNSGISQNGFEIKNWLDGCFIDVINYNATPKETPNLGIMPW